MDVLSIYFVTSNTGKVESARKWLKPRGISVYKYPRKIDVPERKMDTVEEVAIQKIEEVKSKIRKPFIAQDSGFFIEALKGYPGPDVNNVLKTMGVPGLLKMIPKENRSCYFRDILAFWSPSYEKSLPVTSRNKPKLFISEVRGNIAMEPADTTRKGAWSSLWTIFVPDDFNKPLSMLSHEEQEAFAQMRSTPASNCFVAFAEWAIINSHFLYFQKPLHYSLNVHINDATQVETDEDDEVELQSLSDTGIQQTFLEL